MLRPEDYLIASKYMFQYAKLLTEEAEKYELHGIKSEPDLFDTASKVFELAEIFSYTSRNLRLLKLPDFITHPMVTTSN